MMTPQNPDIHEFLHIHTIETYHRDLLYSTDTHRAYTIHMLQVYEPHRTQNCIYSVLYGYNRIWITDISITHSHTEEPLYTKNHIQGKKIEQFLYDATQIYPTQNIFVYASPYQTTETMKEYGLQIVTLYMHRNSYATFTKNDADIIHHYTQDLCFSRTQIQTLRYALWSYHIRSNHNIATICKQFLPITIRNKQERNDAFKYIITQLNTTYLTI